MAVSEFFVTFFNAAIAKAGQSRRKLDTKSRKKVIAALWSCFGFCVEVEEWALVNFLAFHYMQPYNTIGKTHDGITIRILRTINILQCEWQRSVKKQESLEL